MLEIYLLIAIHVALKSDAIIAPPLFIFFLLHHWITPGIVVAFVCGCEFVLWRTRIAGAVLILAIMVAGVGNASLQMF